MRVISRLYQSKDGRLYFKSDNTILEVLDYARANPDEEVTE